MRAGGCTGVAASLTRAASALTTRLCGGAGYETYGFTRDENGIMYREWAPAAQQAFLIGDFNDWDTTSHGMSKNDFGVFELNLPDNVRSPPSLSLVRLHSLTFPLPPASIDPLWTLLPCEHMRPCSPWS
jgi:hypothetical protein